MSNQYIDILKNHGIVMQANSIYPIYKVSNKNEAIVRFTDEHKGICINSPLSSEQ